MLSSLSLDPLSSTNHQSWRNNAAALKTHERCSQKEKDGLPPYMVSSGRACYLNQGENHWRKTLAPIGTDLDVDDIADVSGNWNATWTFHLSDEDHFFMG